MNRRKRRGLSLLELVIASSMLAVLVTAISVIMRTASQSWEAHEADYSRIEAGHATVRHVLREIRQADAVVSISGAADNSGRLSLVMQNGDVVVWDHDDSSNEVDFTSASVTGLLANQVTGLRFTGYLADGTTTTTVPDEVQFVKIDVTIELPRSSSGTRVISANAWIRSW